MNLRLTVTAVACVAVNAAGDPQRDLRSDLQSLNVRITTEHYELAGTVSDEKLDRYGQALEFIHREYAHGFSELIQKPTLRDSKENAEKPFKVVILATAAEYEEFTQAYFSAHAEHTSGLFVSSVDLLIIRDGRKFEHTTGTLFHEAFHQFASRYVSAIPTWLNEGMAAYYGTARATGGGLVFDKPRADQAAIVRNVAKNKKLVPLRRLLDFSPVAFYDQSPVPGLTITHRTLCYAQSYTLISYLINDRDGREHLRAFVRKLSGATSDDDVRHITHDMFPDKLLDAMVVSWLAHVARMRSRT